MQEVLIETDPPGAQCSATSGESEIITSPGKIALPRNSGGVIKCEMPGKKTQKAIIDSDYSPGMGGIGMLVFGVPGLLFDRCAMETRFLKPDKILMKLENE